jgi:putative transposase
MTKYVSFETQGEWVAKDIYQTFIGMAADKQSCHSIQNSVDNIPSEGSIRHHLPKITMDELESINHNILTEHISKMLPRNRAYEFSIDTTDDPYYGKTTSENDNYIVGGKSKKSSNKFYRYASLYLVHNQIKITIAILPVREGVNNLEYVQRFIELIERMNFQVKVLLLDRGFYSVKIFRYLLNNDIPHIVPVFKRGKKILEMLSVMKSRREQYRIRSQEDGILDITIAFDLQYLKGRFDKNGEVLYGYVIYGIDWTPRKIYKTYRRRFAIEASYRLRNQVRPRTSTRNPTFRYLMAIISLLLVNTWVYFKWKYFSLKQRGPKVIVDELFRLDRFIKSIMQAFIMKTRAITNINTLLPVE